MQSEALCFRIVRPSLNFPTGMPLTSSFIFSSKVDIYIKRSTCHAHCKVLGLSMNRSVVVMCPFAKLFRTLTAPVHGDSRARGVDSGVFAPAIMSLQLLLSVREHL